MIISFTVKNFKSFKDEKTLSFETSTITEHPENIFHEGGYSLLKSAVIYGPNSSGKSNLLDAIRTMRLFVLNSANQSSVSKINILPFLLNKKTANEPTLFDMKFLLKESVYRYGFELTQNKIHAEWLIEETSNIEGEKLFLRSFDDIYISEHFKEGLGLESKTRPNALFLSTADQFNGEISNKILRWFNQLYSISGLDHEVLVDRTVDLLQNGKKTVSLLKFLTDLDLGFKTITIEKGVLDEQFRKIMPPELIEKYKPTFTKFKTNHEIFNNDGLLDGEAEFDLREQESSGTNKIFDLTGSIFKAIVEGGILIIDELDAKLHPLITISIVKLFHSPVINSSNAQLIFATHDTNLLSYGNFRRDQIYFTEKDRFSATDLYSLVEYKENGKKIRKDRSFEKDYIQGRYGAIPYLGDFKDLF